MSDTEMVKTTVVFRTTHMLINTSDTITYVPYDAIGYMSVTVPKAASEVKDFAVNVYFGMHISIVTMHSTHEAALEYMDTVIEHRETHAMTRMIRARLTAEKMSSGATTAANK